VVSFGKSKSSKSDPASPVSLPDEEKRHSSRTTAVPADESLVVSSAPSDRETPQEEVEGVAARDEAAAGSEGPESAPGDSDPKKIKKLTEEKAGLLDQLLRKQAEFENFRKRTERERTEFARYANFEMVRDLLPVLDGFERALKVESAEAQEGIKRGMELIYKQLFDGLKKAGLAPIESLGRKFDPNFHQAVAHEERDDVEDNTVVEEFQRGYLFQGRLLRAAMVKVAAHRTGPQA